jgi:hypothetical protein
MLRRGALWHRLAVEFSRLALGLPAAGPTEVAAAFRDAAGGRHLALATAWRERAACYQAAPIRRSRQTAPAP